MEKINKFVCRTDQMIEEAVLKYNERKEKKKKKREKQHKNLYTFARRDMIIEDDEIMF